MNPREGVISETGEWIINRRLRQGLRDALDAGRGQLKIDPQDLADRLGRAIDMEVERIARIRRRIEQKRRVAHMLRQPESYIAPNGRSGVGNEKLVNE